MPEIIFYEKCQLNQSYFEIIHVPSPDTEEEFTNFVIVDIKEYEPYSIEEWNEILKKDSTFKVDDKRMYASLQKGAPRELYKLLTSINESRRRSIWLYLAKVEQTKEMYKGRGSNNSIENHLILVTYERLVHQECACKAIIKKDVPRTFPQIDFFKENVLHIHTEN